MDFQMPFNNESAETPDQLVEYLAAAIQRGEILPFEYARFVHEYLPPPYQQAARYQRPGRSVIADQLLSGPQREDRAPVREYAEGIEPKHTLRRENRIEPPRSHQEAIQQGIQLEQYRTPNVFRGELDEELRPPPMPDDRIRT